MPTRSLPSTFLSHQPATYAAPCRVIFSCRPLTGDIGGSERQTWTQVCFHRFQKKNICFKKEDSRVICLEVVESPLTPAPKTSWPTDLGRLFQQAKSKEPKLTLGGRPCWKEWHTMRTGRASVRSHRA